MMFRFGKRKATPHDTEPVPQPRCPMSGLDEDTLPITKGDIALAEAQDSLVRVQATAHRLDPGLRALEARTVKNHITQHIIEAMLGGSS